MHGRSNVVKSWGTRRRRVYISDRPPPGRLPSYVATRSPSTKAAAAHVSTCQPLLAVDKIEGTNQLRCSIHLYSRIYGATSTMYTHIRVPCRVLHPRSWWLLVNVNVPREVAVTLLGHKRPVRIIANIPILYAILLYKKQSCYWRHKITTLVESSKYKFL
jgi:hypothetical protein